MILKILFITLIYIIDKIRNSFTLRLRLLQLHHFFRIQSSQLLSNSYECESFFLFRDLTSSFKCVNHSRNIYDTKKIDKVKIK